jgi:membrane protein required for colicin V production
MNGFDLAIIVVILVFAGIGVLRGLVREVFSLLAWAAAGLISWLFVKDVDGWFINSVQDPLLRRLVASVVLFGTVFILTSIGSFFVRRLFFEGRLKTPDHVLGGLFGAARGAAMITIVFLLAALTAFPREPWWRESYFAGYFQSLALWVVNFFPADIAHYFSYR